MPCPVKFSVLASVHHVPPPDVRGHEPPQKFHREGEDYRGVFLSRYRVKTLMIIVLVLVLVLVKVPHIPVDI